MHHKNTPVGPSKKLLIMFICDRQYPAQIENLLQQPWAIRCFDYQLCKAQQKFNDQVFTFNLHCCHRLRFQWRLCLPLMSLATKRMKLQETSKVAHGNAVISSLKALLHLTQLINLVGLSLHTVFVIDLHLPYSNLTLLSLYIYCFFLTIAIFVAKW